MGIIKRNISKERQGFTLAELLIAISITSVSIILFFNVTIFVLKANNHNKKFTIATVLAQELLEEVKGTSTVTSLNTTYIRGGFDYTGSRTVSYGNGTSTSGFFQTEVSVIWTESDNTKSVEMVSFHGQQENY